MANPTVSVVVCTRNRVESLKRCLKAMFALATQRTWELIIVNNGSSDGTGEYLARLRPHVEGLQRITVIDESRPGLAIARNSGWRRTASDLVAFTDDDCYVSSGYIDVIAQAFEETENLGFMGGRILLHDPDDFKITILEAASANLFPAYTFIAAGAVQGANMAFRRSVLEQIGGFDEALGAGTRFPCEDIDAVAAAIWQGYTGLYEPRCLVYHHHGRKTLAEAKALMRGYDHGRGAYYMKYLLQSSSRSAYFHAWLDSAHSEFCNDLKHLRLPVMRRTRREVARACSYFFCSRSNRSGRSLDPRVLSLKGRRSQEVSVR